MRIDDYRPLLQAIGMAEAAGEDLDPAALADELSISAYEVRERLEHVEAWGLAFTGLSGTDVHLRDSGRQFLALDGEIDWTVLKFVPLQIDDLNARAALIEGGSVVLDVLRNAINAGDGEAAVRDLVPPAFALAVDEAVALDFLAAVVALRIRLANGEAAACVAEEIVAVAFMDRARNWLTAQEADGRLDAEDAASARGAVGGLFELFEDDDVLELFEMVEPADAAIAGGDVVKQQMGVVDQRVEAWFKPFGQLFTGHQPGV